MTRRAGAHTPHTGGFTLAEVLVALVILGGGMIVLVNAYHSALRLHMYTADEVDERMLLESAVGRAEMAIAAEELSGGGDFGPRYPDYRWSFEAEERQNVESPYLADTQFYSVSATLYVPGGTERSVTFYTFSNPEMQSVRMGP